MVDLEKFRADVEDFLITASLDVSIAVRIINKANSTLSRRRTWRRKRPEAIMTDPAETAGPPEGEHRDPATQPKTGPEGTHVDPAEVVDPPHGPEDEVLADHDDEPRVAELDDDELADVFGRLGEDD